MQPPTMAISIARAPFTIIVPAFNEEQVIARTLAHLLDGWDEGARPRIIVACNGCRDGTADAARRFADVEVIELPVGSKTGAINAGIARTGDFPVIIVDADVRIGPKSLSALAEVLREDGVMAASPSARLETGQSSAAVRAYYRVWSALGYLDSGVGGAGVYGLSETGARMLGTLPQVTGDDTYVRWSFPLAQQRRLPAAASQAIIEAPRSLSDLLACEARWQAGNRQLRAMMEEPDGDKAGGAGNAAPAFSDRLIYYGIKLAGRLRLMKARMAGTSGAWGRDLSSRKAPLANTGVE